jgi:regulatory protein
VQPKSSKGREAKLGDAVGTGLRLLGRRDHSREELRRKLNRRGHDQRAIEDAIQRIDEAYGLDDRAFARSYVRRRAAARGPMAIAGELAARGVDREAADAALAEFGAAEQLHSATRLAERLHDRQPAGMGYREMLDAIATKLLRRGFPTTIVRAACRAVLAEAAQPPDD